VAYQAALEEKREKKPRRRSGIALRRCEATRCGGAPAAKVNAVEKKAEPAKPENAEPPPPAQAQCNNAQRPTTLPGHTTDVSAPGGTADTRSTVGVGERVKFWSDVPGTWVADSAGPGSA